MMSHKEWYEYVVTALASGQEKAAEVWKKRGQRYADWLRSLNV